MTKQRAQRVTAAFACILAAVLLGCDGGESSAATDFVAAAQPAPPAPPPVVPSGQTVYRPTLYIEQSRSDGAKFLRVEEPLYDPFRPGTPQRTIADKAFGPQPGVNIVVNGPDTTLVRNVDVVQMKHGLTLQGSARVSIYDYTYTGFDGAGAIFGAAIKLGDNDQPTQGDTYIRRVVADGQQAPDATYKISNNDFIGVELDSGSIFIRDVTGGHFGDAGVDTKSTHVYLMNATLSGGHRMLRAWPGVEITLVNSIINASEGHAQAWIYDDTAKIRYFNTLWCQDAAQPSPSHANCSRTPQHIEGETMPAADIASRLVPLSANPLPDLSPFFHTQMDQIVVETSTDNGATWQILSLPNTGGPGSPPMGDLRFAIPLDLSAEHYLFRASYRWNGAAVGEHSLVIDEAGNVTS